MRLDLLAAAAAGAVALTTAPAARANGRFPAANRIVIQPSAPDVVVVRATYGVMVSRDRGATWTWLCEDAFGVPASSVEDPQLELTASGAMIAGPPVNVGLAVSPDTGCTWVPATGPLSGQLVKDLVVRPDAPDVVLAVTSTYGPDAGLEGGSGYAQQIYMSPDDGTTWSALGTPIDPSAVVTTIEVAASDPHRIYVAALRGAQATRTASLFVSTDDGDHWTEQPIPIDINNESAAYLAAVDPTNADRVYIRTLGAGSRLLVTTDAGRSYTDALDFTGSMLGFALSPDGSKVYAGSPQDGLYVATGDNLQFSKASTLHVQCLATDGPDLWACSDEPSGFVAGMSTDDGATFAPKLHLVAPPLIACAARAAAAQCGGAPRTAFCQMLTGCPVPGDAAAEAGSVTPAAVSKACGCTVAGQPRRAAAALSCAALLVGVARRRRGTGMCYVKTRRPWTFFTSSCSSARSSSSTSRAISRSRRSSG